MTRNQIIAFIVGMAICFIFDADRQNAVLFAAIHAGSSRLPWRGLSFSEHCQGDHRLAGCRLLFECLFCQFVWGVSGTEGKILEITGYGLRGETYRQPGTRNS